MKNRTFLVFLICLICLAGCEASPMKAGVSVKDRTDSKVTETSFSEETYEIINEFTDEQILASARDLYVQCLAVSEKYLSGCVFETDSSVSLDHEGKVLYMVSDSRINSFDDVYSEWMTVFNKDYSKEQSDCFSRYFWEDNKVWADTDPYKPDLSYIDTVLVKVLSRKDNEAEIQAVSTYQKEDGSLSKSDDVFSVVYSSNTFRAGKFKMPY